MRILSQSPGPGTSARRGSVRNIPGLLPLSTLKTALGFLNRAGGVGGWSLELLSSLTLVCPGRMGPKGRGERVSWEKKTRMGRRKGKMKRQSKRKRKRKSRKKNIVSTMLNQ